MTGQDRIAQILRNQIDHWREMIKLMEIGTVSLHEQVEGLTVDITRKCIIETEAWITTAENALEEGEALKDSDLHD